MISMKCYSIILGALFLAVPTHPTNSDNLKTALYVVVAIRHTFSFAKEIIELGERGDNKVAPNITGTY